MAELPYPLNTFRLEKHAGEYKDFGLAPDDPYPIKGVTYPVDYGDIAGYKGEDGADLDVFLGTQGDIQGYIKVGRPDLKDGEHKFYVNLTEDEEKAVLSEFRSALLENGRFATLDELLAAIKPFAQQPE